MHKLTQADTIGRQSTREEAADRQRLFLAECILGTTCLASLHFVAALVSLSRHRNAPLISPASSHLSFIPVDCFSCCLPLFSLPFLIKRPLTYSRTRVPEIKNGEAVGSKEQPSILGRASEMSRPTESVTPVVQQLQLPSQVVQLVSCFSLLEIRGPWCSPSSPVHASTNKTNATVKTMYSPTDIQTDRIGWRILVEMTRVSHHIRVAMRYTKSSRKASLCPSLWVTCLSLSLVNLLSI